MSTLVTASTAQEVALPPLSALMAELNFDEADLQANRNGLLGPNQILRLQYLQRRALLIGGILFFSFAFLATIFIFVGQQNGSAVLSFIGVLMTLCNAIGTGFFARQWMRLATDLREGKSLQISGQLERVVRPNGQVNQFVLRISPYEFSVKKEVFRLFRHEQRYRLCYAHHAWLLLSAEALSSDDPTQL